MSSDSGSDTGLRDLGKFPLFLHAYAIQMSREFDRKFWSHEQGFQKEVVGI